MQRPKNPSFVATILADLEGLKNEANETSPAEERAMVVTTVVQKNVIAITPNDEANEQENVPETNPFLGRPTYN